MFVSHLKLLHHSDRIREMRDSGHTAPINVQVCPYDAECNHACPGCTAGFKGFTGSVMSLTAFQRLVEDCCALGVRSLTFTGGSEPTLHPEFEAFVETACCSGLDVALITNGSVMPAPRASFIVERLVWVRVSLDAASEERFLRMHGRGAEDYYKVLANIRQLADAKRQLVEHGRSASSVATIGIGFLTTPTVSCIQEILSAARMARELGADYIQYRPMIRTPHGPELDWQYGSEQAELFAALDAARALSDRDFQVVLTAEKYERVRAAQVRPYEHCHFVHFAPAVSASGNVTLCCHHMENDDFIIGNINEQRFFDIWSSREKRRKVADLPLHQCPLLCRGVGANELLESESVLPAAGELVPCAHVNFI